MGAQLVEQRRSPPQDRSSGQGDAHGLAIAGDQRGPGQVRRQARRASMDRRTGMSAGDEDEGGALGRRPHRGGAGISASCIRRWKNGPLRRGSQLTRKQRLPRLADVFSSAGSKALGVTCILMRLWRTRMHRRGYHGRCHRRSRAGCSADVQACHRFWPQNVLQGGRCVCPASGQVGNRGARSCWMLLSTAGRRVAP